MIGSMCRPAPHLAKAKLIRLSDKPRRHTRVPVLGHIRAQVAHEIEPFGVVLIPYETELIELGQQRLVVADMATVRAHVVHLHAQSVPVGRDIMARHSRMAALRHERMQRLPESGARLLVGIPHKV